MRAGKQAGKRERERMKPNLLLLLTEGSDLIIVQEYLSKGKRLVLGKGWEEGHGSVAGCSSWINPDKGKTMFYFCTALYLSTGANYPGLGTFAVL